MKFAYAQALCTAMIDQARSRGFKPVAAAVLDARGSVRAVLVEDGCSIRRAEIAIAKANAALAMGETTRELAAKPPHFLAGIAHIVGGMVPTPGGVFVRDGSGTVVGAVGVSGESSDNDEQIALAAIEAVSAQTWTAISI
jgi:uncharacterized protein GlcG (DUF336 family)